MRQIGLALVLTLSFFGQSAIAAPDEELLDKSKGYPAGTRANWYTDDAVRVGSYTNLDKLLPNQYHVLRKAEEELQERLGHASLTMTMCATPTSRQSPLRLERLTPAAAEIEITSRRAKAGRHGARIEESLPRN